MSLGHHKQPGVRCTSGIFNLTVAVANVSTVTVEITLEDGTVVFEETVDVNGDDILDFTFVDIPNKKGTITGDILL
ncbi:hypothetical protein ScPMuIL_016613 [Solemya velum]